MLGVHGRKPVKKFVEPVAGAMLRLGLTPNVVTLAGTAIAVLLTVVLIPTNHLVSAAILIALFSAFDMVDGTMARLRGGGTAYGATLDASCDRITDGALFAAIAMWMVYVDGAHPAHVAACLTVLVLSQVISYIKARGEAGGLKIVGGLVERPERLIVALLGLGLEGFGVPHAVEVSIWLLVVGSAFTVVQRLMYAHRDPQANVTLAPPPGA
ncbi:CDP-alcohol phosphatidyltransferase family protein [Corynebacterium sp. TA-R-1]|uniref:Phosphatidylinositol phosphate synthase n=1 Tax=Corynebacterium stercoris TaxID=2943490 RepID=A0ABT1G2B5_9CORY|nr:CDP-alcohol phosphatidyltransferase family protein [Corynebacterium stercoris]MCP1387193.1 CDP-alcohol phosphatidyltransferase family protein [Corynebacterium stercoris]